MKFLVIDPNIVTRAIYYLDCISDYPRGTETSWFTKQLEVLIELTCPNAQLNKEALEFVEDIKLAI